MKTIPYLTARQGLGLLCLCLLWLGGLPGCAEERAASAKTTEALPPDTAVTQTRQAVADTAAAPATPKPGRKNVLLYFRELPEPYALPYRIWKEGRMWWAQHLPSGKKQQAFVDLQNGYLELSHTGDASRSESIQLALFRMAGGEPVIGLCRTQARQSEVEQSCYFLRPEDEEQLDWTEHTVPVFRPQDFLGSAAEEFDPQQLEAAFPVLLKLPQYGTELLAQPYLGRKFYYCRDEATRDERALCPLFSQLQRRSFRMNWNRQSGQFQ